MQHGKQLGCPSRLVGSASRACHPRLPLLTQPPASAGSPVSMLRTSAILCFGTSANCFVDVQAIVLEPDCITAWLGDAEVPL